MKLNPKAAQALAWGLNGDSYFHTIDLSATSMGDEGCAAFCDTLLVNTTCSTFSMKYDLHVFACLSATG